MHAHAVFPLLCCILFPRVTRPAPTAGPSPALRDALERARMLADKISKDVPTVLAQASTLDFLPLTSDLQMMATALHIPPAPVLKPLSPNFNVDTCMSRMAAGVRMFQGLLEVLSERLGGLDSLQADLRDLLAHVDKAREVAGPSGGNASLDEDLDQWAGLAARLQGDYETQAAAHLTLTQLRSFMHDVIRSLRAITGHRTLAR
ncbi:colony stimulating factor 3 (granulocyte) b [Hippocampus comes]|uniref:colony stimulating factor 3 (granulocyte) b n=1 Tax=Hippocampus comes TaxID=109280 RepID=UPI00094EF250|nr:PREDICTED: granulocyte colony-stimulating factor-like [Hippocampus comes]